LVKPPIAVGTNGGYFVHPALSPTGGLIAWGFATSWDITREHNRARYALGIYSIGYGAWKTFGDFDEIGYPAFSPDGSKLAVVAKLDDRRDLRFFDVAGGTMSDGPITAECRQAAP
jgi:hypothetical protein